jgi:hypothetical protein
MIFVDIFYSVFPFPPMQREMLDEEVERLPDLPGGIVLFAHGIFSLLYNTLLTD